MNDTGRDAAAGSRRARRELARTRVALDTAMTELADLSDELHGLFQQMKDVQR